MRTWFQSVRRKFCTIAVCCLPLFFARTAEGADLPVRAAAARDPRAVAAIIDREIEHHLVAKKIAPSLPTDDAEFLRRAYLDLTGRIPTADKASAFLASTEPAKRSKLVEELLASSEYGQHFATVWLNLIPRDANMIRPPDAKPFSRWLAERFHQGQGWDRIVAGILTAEGTIGEQPPAVYFVLSGDSRGNPQANIIARNTTQLFMGVQMQCAECHDHPFTDWKQTDFWGTAAFFVKVTNASKNGKGQAAISEKAFGGKGKAGKQNLGPKTAGGTSIVIPSDAFKNVGQVVKAKFPGGAEPALDPQQPFRPAFAAWLTAPENAYFAPNMVNRLWAHFFGRGFVNSLNDFHEANPASHPELLQLLAKEFVASGFDQKHLIRCIMNSQAYQRSSQPVPGNKGVDNPLFGRMQIKVLSPEMLYDSLAVALEVRELFPAPRKASQKKKKGTGTPAPNLAPREQFLAFFNTKEQEGEATEFSHGIPQAMLLMNNAAFNTGGGLVERLLKQSGGTKQVIEGLYLAALSRPPTPTEAKEMAGYVARRSSQREGYNSVLWVLLNSSEFILNH